MTDILNEESADKQVIHNLLKELRKRGYMGKLLVDPVNGDIYVAQQFDLLSDEKLDDNVRESQENIDAIKKAREFAAKLAQVDQPAPEVATPAPAPAPTPELAPVQEPQQLAPAEPQTDAPAPPVLS